MIHTERYVFEVTYDVRDDYREEYEAWLSTTTVAWMSSETVCGFHSEQSLAVDCPDVRLLLEFETLADWLTFVDSQAHQRHLLELRTLTNGLDACLWEPTPISLTPPTDSGLLS
ncbi:MULTISPECIES: hypothetical protein [Haloferax]|uniref:ABM domain-containing protein n=1 Tax=Haloferax marinum TaxID=2666143 RepID=A0A6A8G6S3_9EURY|nr:MULTISPECIES: hypothetical protein [Haloferax]KAB1197462.1 hypothetical protein Hfx1150_08020 [Haloferax sp. CBA1150]MRW96507.1 hypothetical protein [Haloferax marinum]